MSQKIWKERRLRDPQRPNDVRTEWERDYARLVHSSAFRRLQSKTQVLGLGESDFYRTRLTHSMEVAQIGVGIVRWLQNHHEQDSEILNALPKPSLMNSICLAHDIGHPPFGHGGEVALNLCMRDYGGFEGNGQTLRILSKLDKYTDGYGMNPTRRLLLGILKYPASYSDTVLADAYGEVNIPRWLSKANKQKPPKCYLDDEISVVDWVLAPLTKAERKEFTRTEPLFDADTDIQKHNKPKYKALDTSIMELADDISYSLHDLEDAISLRMVTSTDWKKHNELSSSLFAACSLNIKNLTTRLFSDNSFERKKAIGDLVHKFIVNTHVAGSKVTPANNPLIKWNAVLDDNYQELRKHLFELVNKKVIKSPNVQQLEFKGQKLVVELFDALNSDPERLLPPSTLRRFEHVTTDKEQKRVICDYISGMTDEYATRLYEKIYYPHKGSIFDRL